LKGDEKKEPAPVWGVPEDAPSLKDSLSPWLVGRGRGCGQEKEGFRVLVEKRGANQNKLQWKSAQLENHKKRTNCMRAGDHPASKGKNRKNR